MFKLLGLLKSLTEFLGHGRFVVRGGGGIRLVAQVNPG